MSICWEEMMRVNMHWRVNIEIVDYQGASIDASNIEAPLVPPLIVLGQIIGLLLFFVDFAVSLINSYINEL